MSIAGSHRPWPPLIASGHVPRWVKWRDFVLTGIMWLLFAVMLEAEFELFAGPFLEHVGVGDFDTEGNWAEFFERLLPFVQIGVVLVAVLVVASLSTLRRRARGLLMPAPPALGMDEQARRSGMSEADLVAARELRIAVVHIENDGKHRVEARTRV